jgi:hypothetical protein
VVVSRSQVSGSRSCSFANDASLLSANPHNHVLVSPQPSHPSSDAPGPSIRPVYGLVAVMRIRPLT